MRGAGSDPMRNEGVRASVRVLCVVARRDSIAPEHFVVQLKEMMGNSAALDAVPREKRDEIRGDVVRFAINAYYGDAR
jgi:hypothetical protein